MITLGQKARARKHLGYLGVQAVETFHLGVPAVTTTQFMIEGAWDKILPEHEGMFEKALCQLDAIEESAIMGGIAVADATQTGSISINPNRLRDLARLYREVQGTLANMLGVIPNPFDQRRWFGAGAESLNVPVSG